LHLVGLLSSYSSQTEKLSLCSEIQHYVIKKYGGTEIQLHVYETQPVILTPKAHYCHRKCSRPFLRGCEGYRIRLYIVMKQFHYRSQQTLRVPRGCEAPRFQDNRHMKVVRLSALRTGRLYPQEIFLDSFLLRLSRPQGHSAAGRIMSMKNSNDTNGNGTHDLPACSAVPQPTTSPRAPFEIYVRHRNY
jgi:hypothetical protein